MRRSSRLERVVRGDAGLLQRLPVSPEALLRRLDRRQVEQRRDAAVTVPQEMAHGLSGAIDVVDRHRVGIDPSRHTIDEHRGQSGAQAQARGSPAARSLA